MISKRIIYLKEDGSLLIMTPNKEALDLFTIEEIAEKSHHGKELKLPYKIVDMSDFPDDWTFRGAWEFDEGVKVNLEKAKEIQTARVREARNKAFLAFDQRYALAQRDKIDLSALDEERQMLKDLPTIYEEKIEKAKSVDELKAIFPEN